MTNFVRDNTALPGPKAQWDGSSPEGTAPNQFHNSADYNAFRDAANDMRAWIKTGLTVGTYSLATLTVDADGRITGVAAGVGLTDGDKGDVVVSGGGTIFTIDTAVVTNAKLASMPTATFKGNNTGGSGPPLDLTIAQVLALLQIKVGGLGDGSSGAAVFDGATAVSGYSGPVANVYTATQENAFTNATFSPGVVLDQTNAGANAGFRLFISGVATITSGTATIKYNGLAAAGVTGGGALGNNPQGNNSAAGAGAIQNAGQTGANAANWSQKVKGGNGGAGGASPTNVSGAGGTVGNTYAVTLGDILTWNQAMLGRINLNNPGIVSGGAGGGSGAGTVGIASGGAGGGGAGVGVAGDQPSDRLRRDQRVIPRENDHGLAAADDVEGGPQRPAGPVRIRLDHGFGAVGKRGREIAVRRDDHGHTARAGLLRRKDGPGDHRSPADRVKDLGDRGAHPRPLPSGHHECGRGRAHPRIVGRRPI